MKVLLSLFNIPLSQTSGSSTYVLGLSKYLASTGADVYVLCNKNIEGFKSHYESDKLHIIELETERFYNRKATFNHENKSKLLTCIHSYVIKIHEIVKLFDIDIIHFQHLVPHNYVAAFCNTLLDIPTICTFHGTEHFELGGDLNKYFFDTFYNRIICVSHPMKLLFDGDPSKISVIPPGVPDYRSYDAKQQKEDVVTFLGRLEEEKGIIQTIELFLKLSSTNQFSGFVLEIVGTGSLGDHIVSKYDKNIKKGNIRLIGSIPHIKVPDYLSYSKLVIFGSTWDEPFGMVIIETMALGIPLISTNVGVIQDILPMNYKYISNDRDELQGYASEILLDNSIQLSLKSVLQEASMAYHRDNVGNRILSEYNQILKTKFNFTYSN